jgi:hypothetical protein
VAGRTKRVKRETSIGLVETASSVASEDGFDSFVIDESIFDLSPSSSSATVLADDESTSSFSLNSYYDPFWSYPCHEP